jgi:hypothetical protein
MSIEEKEKTPIYNLLRLQLENEQLKNLLKKCKENIESIKHCASESLTVISQITENDNQTKNNLQKDKFLLLLQMLETEIMMADELMDYLMDSESGE